MRAVIQRVAKASVTVDGRVAGEIERGLVALVGVHRDDDTADAARLADRLLGMRIFDDQNGKLNLSLNQVNGSILAVSNFTVYGDASQRRPSFVLSAGYERGKELFARLVEELEKAGCPVQTGEFGAQMIVELANDGPVTLVVDTR